MKIHDAKLKQIAPFRLSTLLMVVRKSLLFDRHQSHPAYNVVSFVFDPGQWVSKCRRIASASLSCLTETIE